MNSFPIYKLAILNNLITPYRVPIYRGLGTHFDTYLLLSGEESNRDTWQNLDRFLVNVTVRNVWGFTLKFFDKRNGKTFDPRYLHINPGYLWSLLEIGPDVLISAEMGFRSIIALLYGFFFKKPVWILWGGTPHTERNRSYFKKLIRRLIFTRVTRWISYGKTTTDYLLELGIDRNHILQIQNCVDEKLFIPDDIDAVLERSPSPTLLYTGQLIKRKGIDLFLKTAAKLQKEGCQFSIQIVGSGIEQQNIVTLISQLGLKNVYVLPSQKPEDMPAIYKSADIFVFPTLEEVWGLVVNEALWSGLTVVSSIYAGCAEEILPPENLFDPLDQQSTINVLEKAINGELPKPSTSRLYTCDQVIELIVDEITDDLFAKRKSVSSSSFADT